MPTLRELIEAIQRRPGVRTVVILGADGLVIETHNTGYDYAEALAARVPAVATAVRQLGDDAALGEPNLILLELDQGFGIILRLSAHAMLFVSADDTVALGELLSELRRHRASMAALL